MIISEMKTFDMIIILLIKNIISTLILIKKKFF